MKPSATATLHMICDQALPLPSLFYLFLDCCLRNNQLYFQDLLRRKCVKTTQEKMHVFKTLYFETP